MNMQETLLNFNKVLDNAPGPIMITDNNTIIYANQNSYRLLGYEKNSPVFLWDIFPEKDYNRLQLNIEKVLTGEKSVEIKNITLRTKGDNLVTTKLYIYPYDSRQSYVQICMENTDSIKLRSDFVELKEKYHNISKYISDVIAYYNDNGAITYVTPSVNSAFGYKSDLLIGRSAFDYVHPQDRSRVKYIFKTLSYNAEQKQVRFRVKKNIGTYVWVDSVFYRIENDQDSYILGNLKAIDKQIEAEKLAMQTEKLALTGELSAGIVHEIKNPLTSVKGFLQLMEAGTIDTKDYINILKAEVERMEAMAVNMLSFAKPNNHFGQHNLKDIIQDVFSLMEIQANKNHIYLKKNEHSPDVFVHGDEAQLKQVLINLVKNAIEASEPNHNVEIQLCQDCINGYIKVTDYGAGIPNHQLKNIGKSFYTTKKEGTGLGLMVSYRIIEHHQGQIKVNSKSENGTTFTICLPKVREKESYQVLSDCKSGT
ncbi:sporulation kinase KinA [Salinibacillus aidingensis]|uniref:histidine kinase n=1 Tax=Salinibacillus aidingensis TaxID=237684 RepID=A0ABN1AMV1_9BACI